MPIITRAQYFLAFRRKILHFSTVRCTVYGVRCTVYGTREYAGNKKVKEKRAVVNIRAIMSGQMSHFRATSAAAVLHIACG
mgnify:CR=1 FL=1